MQILYWIASKCAICYTILMRYPIAIESSDGSHTFGVAVPDFPGCFSAGETIGEIFDNTQKAMLLWIGWARKTGQKIPKPTPFLDCRKIYPEYISWFWISIDLDDVTIIQNDLIPQVQPCDIDHLLPRLSTVKNLPAYFPAAGLTMAAIQNHIFKSQDRFDSKGRKIAGNGLAETGAIIRRGRKILIDVDRYGAWLTQSSPH